MLYNKCKILIIGVLDQLDRNITQKLNEEIANKPHVGGLVNLFVFIEMHLNRFVRMPIQAQNLKLSKGFDLADN